jgi:HprK-related kinase A
MNYEFSVRIGQIGFRIGSDWRAPIAELRRLYAGYPKPDDDIADYNVRLFAKRPWRRWLRPAVEIGGDYTLVDAAPLPLAQGLLAAEMAMNLQLALGHRRHLLIHAACVERDGRALLMTGESGSGKSTLAALLSARGWRLMGDELALLDLDSGELHAFPRLVSLKNQSIAAVEAAIPQARFGPLMRDTPKGDIRHMVPDRRAVVTMTSPARPALILFPSFGFEIATREMPRSEVFVRLTQASTNYVALGERGFRSLTGLVARVPTIAVDYPDTQAGVAAIETAWAQL